ncbi:MAG: hypothetical protein JWL96_3167 [Sphingomonas bacterium]|uniref:hypothetical protein n=1 Tax=Sphingomonas bacterium TaxID=1895847 RepID=UPI00260BB54C|nr:hypothetical protein [Sphingomonas bacterium]MDB5711097.1 hypothetical protein [Sphingomonas bacterium]
MATTPQPEAPPTPERAPSELPPPSPDVDVPSPATTPQPPSGDGRSDIQQVVEARRDAVERGEGGREPDIFTSPGLPDGVGGTGGITRNQDADAQ